MKLSQIMTREVQSLAPDSTLVEAAQLMQRLDVGALPVCEPGERLIGIVTDRDLVLRGLAEERDPSETLVQEVLTTDPVHAFEEEDVAKAGLLMRENQIRRLPILSRDGRLVGMVSLGDIAVDAGACYSGEVLREVSEPAQPITSSSR